MTETQPPDSTGRVQSPVPDTFLSGRTNDQPEHARSGWSLGALTGPLGAPLPGAGAARTRASAAAEPPSAATVELPLPGRPRPAIRRLPVRSALARAAHGRPAPPPGCSARAEPANADAARGSREGEEPGDGTGGSKSGSTDTAAEPSASASESTNPPASTVTATDTSVEAPAGADIARGDVRVPPPLPAEDRGRLLNGTHHDPHAHLGAHTTSHGGIRFRALRPDARAVTVLDEAEGLRLPLHDEGDGFFAGEVPGSRVPEYELLVQYGERPGERDVRVLDPYGFGPALGELDLRLFSEGRHAFLWRALGARTMTHRGATGTRFTLWAPDAHGVRVVGDFNRWDGTAAPMRSLGPSGVWELFLPGVGDGAVYQFEVAGDDGSLVRHTDPMARAAQVPPGDGSVVHTPAHRWQDGEWLDRRSAGNAPASPLSVYELHLPSWRPGLSYRELAGQLPPYVKDLGFTHVELMRCPERPSDGSALDGRLAGAFTPDPVPGGPDDFRFLVDALHRAGIGVLMDWEPAHVPQEPGRPELRSFLVADAVHRCEEFHIDGLRMGTAGSMLRTSGADAVSLLQQINTTLRRRCPGVITVAGECRGWDGVTRETHHVGESGFGGLGFSFVWDTDWAQGTLDYAASLPEHRSHRREGMTSAMAHAYAENHLLPVSQEELARGKRSLVSTMSGDRWQRLANLRAYLGCMWAHPGKQLLFMGQEFAQAAEWSQEHGPDWWLLDPANDAAADHRGVRELVRDLNDRYARTAALWQLDTDPAGFSWVEDASGGSAAAHGENVFAFLRFDAERRPLLAVANFSPQVRPAHRLGVPAAGTSWREVLNTDEERYGGSGLSNSAPLPAGCVPAHGLPASITPSLPPLSTVWLRPV